MTDPADRRGATWTDAEEDVIVHLVKDGATLAEIAQRLGRTRGAVLTRMEDMMYRFQKFEAAKAVIKRWVP